LHLLPKLWGDKEYFNPLIPRNGSWQHQVYTWNIDKSLATLSWQKWRKCSQRIPLFWNHNVFTYGFTASHNVSFSCSRHASFYNSCKETWRRRENHVMLQTISKGTHGVILVYLVSYLQSTRVGDLGLCRSENHALRISSIPYWWDNFVLFSFCNT